MFHGRYIFKFLFLRCHVSFREGNHLGYSDRWKVVAASSKGGNYFHVLAKTNSMSKKGGRYVGFIGIHMYPSMIWYMI